MPIDIEQEYDSRLPVWRALKEEALYTLQEAVDSHYLKIHSLDARVKELDSFIGKAAANSYEDPINEINDVVGVRIVTLFKSNLSDIDSIINEEFRVLTKDDKTKDDDSVLGYRSIHYICTIKPEYIGPRYKKISGYKFEIQVRTLCMHAWSAVSHYLDYKGDWDVPRELKASLRALSGLFHVADSQFEQFFVARENYHGKLVEGKSQKVFQELNLETLSNYLDKKFPERRAVNKLEASALVNELRQIDISTVGELDKALDSAEIVLGQVESLKRNKFASIGAVRVSLGLTRQDYRDLKYNGVDANEAKEWFATE